MIRFIGKVVELLVLTVLVTVVCIVTAPFWVPFFGAVLLAVLGS